MKNTLLLLCLFFLSTSQNVFAQEAHSKFKNSSFEDLPRPAIAPVQWFSYDFENQSPPDVHPCNPPVFGVKNKPYHGQTYLGLVTRENKTYESVTQLLEKPFKKEECYSFSIYLAQSPNYESRVTWAKDKIVNFTAPTVLHIWGGNKKNDDIELLVASPAVNHTDWKKYTLTFSPSKKIDHIIFEAYYPNESKPTNGHILLDNLSPITKITCEIVDDEVRPSSSLGKSAVKHLELMTFVQEKNNAIAFKNNNELTSASKIALKEIGATLFHNPDYKALLYFTADKRKEKIARRNIIHAALGQIGYTKDMYEILVIGNSEEWKKQLTLTRRLSKDNNQILVDLGKR